ncbi:MAG: hypothetical protein NZ889_02755, partial [Candidatus Pacearchaeota archaeon]|nr:hypothetical protein [Candidatus Pacearchaeota archaeon]
LQKYNAGKNWKSFEIYSKKVKGIIYKIEELKYLYKKDPVTFLLLYIDLIRKIENNRKHYEVAFLFCNNNKITSLPLAQLMKK